MPKMTEARVSYSTGVKANIGNYESADAHLSESETWDVSDIDPEDVEAFVAARLRTLKLRLMDAINGEYRELKS
jgi:hypothetical protein